MTHPPPRHPLADFLALRSRPSVRWIGLMSGTSCDGIDAALIEVAEDAARGTPSVRCVGASSLAFPAKRQTALLQALAQPTDAETAARWDARLGALFAATARVVIEEYGPADAVALSGHTFAHLPNERTTLQLGNPALVNELLGIPVVAGFRAADVARGGEGAPLVPAGDRLVFARTDGAVAVINIGGISNVTWLPARTGSLFDDANEPRAADCGPGNLILNTLVRRATNGQELFDRDGVRAAAGRVRLELLERWRRHPFLTKLAGSRPQRSTGREEFGEAWVAAELEATAEIPLEDWLATAVDWIAECIALTLASLGGGREPMRVLLGGGGARNPAILRALARHIKVPTEVLDQKLHGVSASLREAVAFALLGHEYLHRRPGSFPGTTGCRFAGPLGALWV
ncbi:MAG: anhydro-N-acetylmuramic acid kinase [Planctomycetota bacterium]